MSYDFIHYEKKAHIACLTLNRPESLNAIHPPMQKEIWNALNDFREDDDAWVVILTGAGDRAFCAGNDLKWKGRYAGEPGPRGWRYRSDPERVGSVGSLPSAPITHTSPTAPYSGELT